MSTETLTIDELARRTGMTVRNIRAHQSRGLLPSPTVRARTGYYSNEHIVRLELIREMQSAGFNLAGIKRMLDATPIGAGEELLRFERLLMAPWDDEQKEVVDADELLRRFEGSDPRLLRKAESLGILRALGDGSYEVLSPAIFRAGAEIAALGIPLEHGLAVVEKVHRHSKGVAQEFVRLFITDVWKPFQQAGFPDDQLPDIREALQRLRALAQGVLVGSFRLQMGDEVEKAFGRELSRAGQRSRRG